MADKELLELAAKAAGLKEYGFMGGSFVHVEDNTFVEWNPLTDDGDKYRLIKKLEISVNFKYQYAEYEGICVFWPQDVKDDAYAVLEVAAEIGRTK